jgi:glutathione S-transferase
MRIYGNPMSTCTRKVLATFAEKNVNPELLVLDFAKGEHKSPEHMKRQPFGQMPVLEDGEFQMYESRAIMRYVDQALPGISLTPADSKQRARMEQWISVEMSDFTPHAMTFIQEHMFKPMFGHKGDPALAEAVRPKLAACCDVLEKALTGKQFLLGDHVSLADIGFLPYIDYLMKTPGGSEITSRPNLNAWWERCSSRPSWKKATGQA